MSNGIVIVLDSFYTKKPQKVPHVDAALEQLVQKDDLFYCPTEASYGTIVPSTEYDDSDRILVHFDYNFYAFPVSDIGKHIMLL